jgi:hypothetical protein
MPVSGTPVLAGLGVAVAVGLGVFVASASATAAGVASSTVESVFPPDAWVGVGCTRVGVGGLGVAVGGADVAVGSGASVGAGLGVLVASSSG